MPGDSVTIEGFAGDFRPGTSMKIYYQLSGGTPQLINNFVSNANLVTDTFRFTINVPNEVTPQSLRIWSDVDGNTAAILNTGYSVINLRPTLKITNKVNQRYYNRRFIDLEVTVWDNTRVMLWYCIDGGREINLTDYIDCNGVAQNIETQIELPPGAYEFGSHKMYIFVRDEFGAESADTPYDFVLYNQNAPDMVIISVDTVEQYETQDVVLLQGKVIDLDVGDKISVNFQLNRQGYSEIYKTIATGEWQFFNYTFTVPKNDGLLVVTFQAKDNWTAASRISRHNYKVRRTSGISFRTSLPSYAEPSLQIEINGYYTRSSIPPQTKVRLRGQFENSGTRFYIDVYTLHNSMSDKDFKWKFTIPDDKGTGNLLIDIVKEENETEVFGSFNLTVNSKPTLKILNSPSERYSSHAFIGLDLEVNDDSKANIRYRIDDGNEINLADFIDLNNQIQTIRKQIEIKPRDISYMKHTIYIYAVDEFGLSSIESNFSFFYYKANSPELRLLNYDDIQDKTFYLTDSIDMKLLVNDADLEDDLTVRMRFDFDNFKDIHTCYSNNRNICSNFTSSINVPKAVGKHEIVLQAFDNMNFSSKDVLLQFNVIKHNVVPARTLPPYPVPSYLPEHYTGLRTYRMFNTSTQIMTTDINGDPYVTYTYIEQLIEIEVVAEQNATSESVAIGFLETKFGKYILWPIIAAAILIITITAILIFIYLKKKEKESSSTEVNDQMEMEAETIQFTKTEENMTTNDNPLYNVSTADDPFHADFEENDRMTGVKDDGIVDLSSGNDNDDEDICNIQL
ncbi:hypothetical protein TVAG_054430 [Trichomonas vaginalis G3]|uniref:Bap-like n=1 Tax=Trichomonas vaginalis (strain ATCC PRA-98 / G3) TaxID=412133 RepID=A2EYB8_TRIV3|nr:ribonuclease H protein family [Trichomonas vaginalis G3]EAY02345.1 hypothetical protein TVAG_054430 [Trichomonas vaginalis G3]KAI5514051.1 ribonuclease H protein family [Trichomonas vaginalis G3]|eukprot:XP_001314660.1 hypothetical protein [Trichomonas vaginalis G3]